MCTNRGPSRQHTHTMWRTPCTDGLQVQSLQTAEAGLVHTCSPSTQEAGLVHTCPPGTQKAEAAALPELDGSLGLLDFQASQGYS